MFDDRADDGQLVCLWPIGQIKLDVTQGALRASQKLKNFDLINIQRMVAIVEL